MYDVGDDLPAPPSCWFVVGYVQMEYQMSVKPGDSHDASALPACRRIMRHFEWQAFGKYCKRKSSRWIPQYHCSYHVF